MSQTTTSISLLQKAKQEVQDADFLCQENQEVQDADFLGQENQEVQDADFLGQENQEVQYAVFLGQESKPGLNPVSSGFQNPWLSKTIAHLLLHMD
jgi:hypothetical protein